MKFFQDTNFLRGEGLERSINLCDLTIVCQDGLAFGHQALLASHSPWLRDIFLSSSPLRNITIHEVPGLPSKLKEVRYSVPLTIHLPDFSIDVVEAFLRSLDGGMTVVSQKDFSHLHQLHLVLGIKEAGGSGFPSLYGAERTEVESLEEEETVDSNYNILPVSDSEDDEGSINEFLGGDDMEDLTEDQEATTTVKIRKSGMKIKLTKRKSYTTFSTSTEEEDTEDIQPSPAKRRRSPRRKIKWIGAGVNIHGQTFYKSAHLEPGNLTVSVGDTVLTEPLDSSLEPFVGQITRLFEDQDELMAHFIWYGRASDTVLGETGDVTELFQLTYCQDGPLDSILKKCRVLTEPGEGVNDFWSRFHFDTSLARFETIRVWPECSGGREEKLRFCGCCAVKQEEVERWRPRTGEKSSNGEYVSVNWDRAPLKVGDSVYLDPDTIQFKIKKKRVEAITKIKEDVDENIYPEYDRKRSYVRGNNNETPDPFQVVNIKKITKVAGEFRLKVSLFYRPEDTHLGINLAESAYNQEVFFTEEKETVSINDVRGRCYVKYIDSNASDKEIETWSEEGPDRWFFREWYRSDCKEFSEPPMSAQRLGHQCCPPSYPTVNKLRGLDIFAGCGGLSHGLQQSGVAKFNWAVEKSEVAAEAYKLNNPDCEVFVEDCNVLLQQAKDGVTVNENGQKIPSRGEVELLCGGPPCQGFSGLNRFKKQETTQLHNSLITTAFDYCEHYRPRFFLLENVKNFSSNRDGMDLKICLRRLVKMGYQCTFAVLQAGHYGVAQSRRRLIIMAAALGENLPLFPEPRHVFSPYLSQLSVQIDEVCYESNARWKRSAPYKTVNVQDTISDLPPIHNGHYELEISYGDDARSHFQKMIRKGSEVLTDHITKKLSVLNEARIELIPTTPGSDWRDLPNKVIKLKDGSYTKKLIYKYDGVRSSTGAKRGVCVCADGKSECDPSDRQDRTLIPWCLPHTSAKNSQWAGSYGRVHLDGFFSTTLTDPGPMKKQGRVLHPDQNRLLSVRECARSQGFPDLYKFYGSIQDKHRQIGNAVPPPMACALGLEIREVMASKQT